MIHLLFTLIFILFGLIIPLALVIYVIYGLYCDIMGAPFVPSSQKYVELALKRAKLKKGQRFIDLGCGDGRAVRTAVKEYNVVGLGVDLHPYLIWYSKLASKLQKLDNAQFKIENMFATDISKADVIFVFLLKGTLKKMKEKFQKESKKGTLIISHGFKIPDFEKHLIEKIDRDIFPTYFYKI